MKRSSILLLTLIVLSMVLAACGGAAKPTQPPAPAAPAAQPTTAPAAAAPAAAQQPAAAGKAMNTGTKYYWLQLLKGHPVHQLTQIGFMTGCKQLGIQCEVVGPDQPDAQQAIAMGEQILAKGDAAGISIWTGSPAYKDLIEKFNAANVPVVAPHFAVPEGTWPKNTVIVGTDPAAYAEEAAKALCTAVGKDTKGSVAVTQGSFNTTEDLVAASFTKKMNEVCPNLKVLKPEEEGFDAPKAVAKAVAIMQANPDLVAALSTTGGGPTTWAGAQKEAGKKIPAIGMDYTRVNLDLVKNGEMYAVVGQPLWDESFKAAELLKKMHAGEAVDYWTKQDAPVITKDQLQKYYDMLDTAEKQMKK